MLGALRGQMVREFLRMATAKKGTKKTVVKKKQAEPVNYRTSVGHVLNLATECIAALENFDIDQPTWHPVACALVCDFIPPCYADQRDRSPYDAAGFAMECLETIMHRLNV